MTTQYGGRDRIADGRPQAQPERVSDPFDLQRFVDAQDRDGTYDQALRELREGRKQSHWMWFVFPQLAGLGPRPIADHYAITCLEIGTASCRERVCQYV